jgi:hypothetical protein
VQIAGVTVAFFIACWAFIVTISTDFLLTNAALVQARIAAGIGTVQFGRNMDDMRRTCRDERRGCVP